MTFQDLRSGRCSTTRTPTTSKARENFQSCKHVASLQLKIVDGTSHLHRISIKLNYQKDGWIRCLSTDLTFHWVRSEGEVDSEQEAKKKLEWAFEQTAFVRELRTLTVGTSTSKATHSLQLVPAKDAALSTVVPAINNGTSLAQELSRYAAMPFQHKEAWFRQQIAKLQVPWEDGHIKINVRRENLLEDSMEATESITQADMRKIFRFEFIAEPG